MLKLLKVLGFVFNSSLTENQICYSKKKSFKKKRLIMLVSHLKSGDVANLFCVLKGRFLILKGNNKIVLIFSILCHGRQVIVRKNSMFHISLGHFLAITVTLKFFWI